tara:strand:- start:842 stop:1177 length:336 start_codon:yes stop_codon:yes gene_type:complete
MKFGHKSALFLGLLSSSVLANDHISPLENVGVFETEEPMLSIRNYSDETVVIDIHGDNFQLTSGVNLLFNCSGYEFLQLEITNNDHEFFEVPCSSRVEFNESFKNQRTQGE